MGEHARAIELEKAGGARRSDVLGNDHSDTASARNSLAAMIAGAGSAGSK
jgi:hypothetical protein